MNTVTIQCPHCHQGSIALEPRLLLQGAIFTCSLCGSGLSVANETSTQLLEQSLDKLEQIKQHAHAKPLM
ncbi:hypothetical protein ORJ04_10835 [Rheinheimera baltica]|uniref:Uncharacterized protein n=1 Tax=Rheinheimera baltica TaxID=67576 RepID=A0ABT9I063_9GAMM|nr:hypothetical protein [Rheinheimera baltica]MDP5136440.1 hypothetical protein [Rheinheimera baltica]MDP5143862.1 hypothetical protein [Rheinheimera baltica]MDP5151710.1 hypothetical protein [Rheinheimera baltica]